MSDIDDSALGRVPGQAAEAAAAMAALRPAAEDAGRAISASFERAGLTLARSLTRAAADGKITLDELAAAALRLVEALVAGRARGAEQGSGLGAALASALAGFSGARADGGPVVSGGAYLVGETGPEVFHPAISGDLHPIARRLDPASDPPPVGGGMTINVSIERGAEPGLAHSEGQIAQALARAVLLGARRV